MYKLFLFVEMLNAGPLKNVPR